MQNRSTKRLPGGFTLIELLIVVAIIAILAAIAVPNFLEAQTRAKVSRAKADMRSVATGLESYYVDHNKYPPAHNPGSPYATGSTSRINPRIYRLTPLTTPIAYLTSVPRDVFNREEATGSASATTSEEVQTFIYVDRRSYAEHTPQPFGISSNGNNLYRFLWGVQYPSSEWLLRSRGPFGGVTTAGVTAAVGDSVDARDAYDPTNGTVSQGNIFMLGPGVGFLGS